MQIVIPTPGNINIPRALKHVTCIKQIRPFIQITSLKLCSVFLMYTFLYFTQVGCTKVFHFVTRTRMLLQSTKQKRYRRKLFALIIVWIYIHSYYMKGYWEHFIISTQRTLDININEHLRDTVRSKNKHRLRPAGDRSYVLKHDKFICI